jgi:hypothetical protein
VWWGVKRGTYDFESLISLEEWVSSGSYMTEMIWMRDGTYELLNVRDHIRGSDLAVVLKELAGSWVNHAFCELGKEPGEVFWFHCLALRDIGGWGWFGHWRYGGMF